MESGSRNYEAHGLSTRLRPSGNNLIVCHRQRGVAGEILSQGPGAPPRTTNYGETEVWYCDRRYALIQKAMDPNFAPRGYDERAEPSDQGPFWLIRAPGLAQWMESPEMGAHHAPLTTTEASDARKGLVTQLAKQRDLLHPQLVDRLRGALSGDLGCPSTTTPRSTDRPERRLSHSWSRS